MKPRYIQIIIILLLLIFFSSCNQDSSNRKIKLSEEGITTRTDDQMTTTIYLEPKERRSIAVLFFENKTGDQNLQWLQKGLTEMFIRSLSQSQYLSILSTDRLVEVMNRLKTSDQNQNIDLDIAAVVAREANVEAVLVGNITMEGDSLKIGVKLKEPNEGKILREESVEGPGLEKILTMVDELTSRIRQDLQLTLDMNEPIKPLSELATNSLEAWRFYTNGVDLMNQFLYQDAIQQFEKSVELDSMFLSAYLKLREGYILEQIPDKARVTYNKIMSLKPYASEDELIEIELIEARRNNDVKKMMTLYEKWLNKNPEDRDANYAQGVLYYGLNNHPKSIEFLKKTVEIDPKHKLALNQLGYGYALMGDYEKAIQTIEKYREIAKQESNPYDSQGEIYLWMGDYKNAEKNFKKAIDINDRFNPGWEHLSTLYIAKGDYKKALEITTRYLENVSEGILEANVYARIGLLNWRIGRLEQAIDNFQKSLDINQNQYWVSKQIHQLHLLKGDTTTAKQVLEKNYLRLADKLKSEQGSDNNYYSLANYSIWDSLYVENTIAFLKALINKTKNPSFIIRAKFSLSLIYLKNNMYEEVNALWADSKPNDLVTLFKDVRNLSFTNLWSFYSVFNELFYRNFEAGIEHYKQNIKTAVKSEVILFEVGFRMLLSDLYLKQKDFKNRELQHKLTGIPEEEKWLVIGPFDNKDGFRKRFPPEKRIRLLKTYKSKKRKINWQHANDGTNDGFIYLSKIFDDTKWTVGYGLIYAESPNEQDVQIRLGTDEAGKLWINNKEVWRFNRRRPAVIDDNTIKVTLKKGVNKILIKVCNQVGDSGFYFRITDENGKGIENLKYHAADKIE